MNCPACNQELTLAPITGIRAQACFGGCGGLWFDRRELNKLKERNPGTGENLLHIERAEGVHIFRNAQHPCPKCTKNLLYRHCFNAKFLYEIDQCARCGGFWVDVGTLSALLPDSLSGPDRQALEAYFQSLFKESLAPHTLSHPDNWEAAEMIHQIYRFLCPPALYPEHFQPKA